jgi:hypothetical protein
LISPYSVEPSEHIEEYRGVMIRRRLVGTRTEFACTMLFPRKRKLVAPTLEIMRAMISLALFDHN